MIFLPLSESEGRQTTLHFGYCSESTTREREVHPKSVSSIGNSQSPYILLIVKALPGIWHVYEEFLFH